MTSNWGPKGLARGNAVSIATLLEMLCRQLLIFPVSLFYIRSWRIAQKHETVTILQIFCILLLRNSFRKYVLFLKIVIIASYGSKIKVGLLTFHCCIINLIKIL